MFCVSADRGEHPCSLLGPRQHHHTQLPPRLFAVVTIVVVRSRIERLEERLSVSTWKATSNVIALPCILSLTSPGPSAPGFATHSSPSSPFTSPPCSRSTRGPRREALPTVHQAPTRTTARRLYLQHRVATRAACMAAATRDLAVAAEGDEMLAE